jgi:predicted phosphodiesterase
MSIRREFLKEAAAVFGLPFLTATSTDPIEKVKLKFAVASDGHFGQKNTPYPMYFDNLVHWLNQTEDLDLVFFNGDLIHDEPTYLAQAKEKMDQLKMPWYAIQGNHDRVSASRWESTLGYPVNHVISKGETAFVMATTSNQAGEYLCADLDWLSTTLHKLKRTEHVFVMLHISQKDWVQNGVDCPQVMELLANSKNVKAVFHGHDHQQHYTKYYQEKPFIFSGHMGGSWGQEYKGYRLVELFEDGKVSIQQLNPLAGAVVEEVWV